MNGKKLTVSPEDAELEQLQQETFGYFLQEANPDNGLVIENYRTGLLWQWMRNCSYIATGLQRAGFGGGWLGRSQSTIRHRGEKCNA